MASSNPDSATSPAANELRSPTVRSLVSLALVVHLLCLAYVYSANVNPSELQRRLSGVLAPYTQAMHLDPGGARLQFTNGLESADDHVVIVARKLSDGTASQADEVRLPGDRVGFSPERHREVVLAMEMAGYAERDDLIALFAQSIGNSVMQARQWDHVFVRVMHRGVEPLNPDALEQERSTNYLAYEAEVWIDEDGQLHTQKKSSSLQSAPAAGGS